MKKPEDCADLQDVREAIDTIDENIIDLIGQRAGYVQVATKFKTDTASVKAPDRVSQMLDQRKKWAKKNQLDLDFIETVFSTMVDYFINKEMKQWSSK